MFQIFVPTLVRSIGDMYKDIAAHAGISNPNLYAYIGMIFSECSSLCGFARLAGWSPSVSAMSRPTQLFDDETQDAMLRRHRWFFLSRVRENPDDWAFVIDTTKNLRRIYGLEGVGRWGDSNGSVFEGQNLLVVAVVHKVSGCAIPLVVLPCLKAAERKDNTNANHRLVEALDLLNNEGWPKLNVVMDSWFDGAWLHEQLQHRKYIYVVQLKSVRKPRKSPGDRAKRHSLVEIFEPLKRELVITGTRENAEQKEKFVSEATVWVFGSEKDKPQIQLKVGAVYNKSEDGEAFGYYATNDLSKSGAWLWNMSRCRWNIEVMFRDLKQYLCFGEFAAKTANGAKLSLVIPIIVLGYLRATHDLTTPLGMLLQRERQAESIRSFLKLNSEFGKNRVVTIINRLNPLHANKKPRSSAAEASNSCRGGKKSARSAPKTSRAA